MADFEDIYNDLMDTVSRPASETSVLTKAKRCVNNAVLFLQRERPLAVTEIVETVTISAGAPLLKAFSSLPASLVIRDIISAQVVTGADEFGINLSLFPLIRINNARLNYQMSAAVDPNLGEAEYVISALGHSNFVSSVHRYIGVLSGLNFGLYPAPTTDVSVRLHYHQWLPELSATTDTNFLLTYAYDLVFMLAAQELRTYLKMRTDSAFTPEFLSLAMEAFYRWDTEVNSQHTD